MYRGLLSKNAAAMAYLASLMLISGCTAHVSGFAPIYPELRFYGRPKVDSAQVRMLAPIPVDRREEFMSNLRLIAFLPTRGNSATKPDLE